MRSKINSERDLIYEWPLIDFFENLLQIKLSYILNFRGSLRLFSQMKSLRPETAVVVFYLMLKICLKRYKKGKVL